ncbi:MULTISPECIES: T6SS immunity protein Tli4 family protein [unclassified Pseudomonas]|uniref:T6SS immunity protein Tli4 family protein n=2 Tax=Gammaproteobacteria TaxID=1236 RepID=UPI00257DE8B8|nr:MULTISPECIES: T6SS immunity protein Tli4 family protein [unclassified Pseudomonas]
MPKRQRPVLELLNLAKRSICLPINCGLLAVALTSSFASAALPIMASPENISKTVLVGRYTLDLPYDAVMSGASLDLDGLPLTITPGYIKAQAMREAQKAWLAIESRNSANAENPAIQETLPDGARLYKYDYTRITGEDLDGSPVNKVVYSTVAYQWANNLKFELGNDSTLNKDEQIKSILQHLDRNSDTRHPGVCFVDGCLPHSPGDEGVYVHFTFTEHPKLRAKFTSKQYAGEAKPALAERAGSEPSPRDQAVWQLRSKAEHRAYRNTKRTVNGVLGEEVIEANTQKTAGGYLTEINAIWYFPGIPNIKDQPELRLDLDYSFTSNQKPAAGTGFSNPEEPNALTEAEFMSIWDAALDSLTAR